MMRQGLATVGKGVLCGLLGSCGFLGNIGWTAVAQEPVKTTPTGASQGAKNPEAWEGYSQRLAAFSTLYVHPYGQGHEFVCPGDSFLVGLRSAYEKGDRRFAYECRFLENAQGQILRKTQRTTPQAPDILFYKGGTSHCAPHSFIEGMVSQIDETSQLRNLGFLCAKVATWQDRAFTTKACTVYNHIHRKEQAFNFACKANELIGKIEATAAPADVILQVTCCSLL